MATRIEDAHVNQILSRWYITMFVLEFPDLPAAHRPIHIADRARLEAELTRRGRVIPIYPPPEWAANGINGVNGVHGGRGESSTPSTNPGMTSGESASSSNDDTTSRENDGQDSVEVSSPEPTPTAQPTTGYVALLQMPTGHPMTQVDTVHNLDINTIAAADDATADEVAEVAADEMAAGEIEHGQEHGQGSGAHSISVEEGVAAGDDDKEGGAKAENADGGDGKEEGEKSGDAKEDKGEETNVGSAEGETVGGETAEGEIADGDGEIS